MLPRLLILAGFALFSASGVTAQDADTYVVRPGDRLTLQLFTAAGQRVQVVEGERIVDRAGDVFLPFVGTIPVAGLDEPAIRRRLVEAYSAYYSEPVLDVKVELKVSITGAVRTPGRFYLDPTATLAEALAVAGGATPEFAVTAVYLPSDPTRVRLVRDGVATTLNFRAQEVDQTTLDMLIKSGDWLHVPFQRRSRIRDDVQFWGSVVGLAASTVGLIFLITR
jgi:polysaccharide export outer membrane protein